VSALHNRIIVTSSTYFVSGVFSLFILFTLATNRRLVVLPLSPQRLWAAWAASTTRGRRGTHAHAHVHAQTAQSTPLFLRRHLILLIYPIFEIKFSITLQLSRLCFFLASRALCIVHRIAACRGGGHGQRSMNVLYITRVQRMQWSVWWWGSLPCSCACTRAVRSLQTCTAPTQGPHFTGPREPSGLTAKQATQVLTNLRRLLSVCVHSR
jgi:hypothetical protein